MNLWVYFAAPPNKNNNTSSGIWRLVKNTLRTWVHQKKGTKLFYSLNPKPILLTMLKLQRSKSRQTSWSQSQHSAILFLVTLFMNTRRDYQWSGVKENPKRRKGGWFLGLSLARQSRPAFFAKMFYTLSNLLGWPPPF